MPPSPPPIPAAIVLAFRDLAAVVRALPGLVVTAAAVYAAADLVVAFAGAIVRPVSAFILTYFVAALCQLFLLTPFFIAVHRFVILGETAGHFAPAPGEPRFQKYFAISAAFAAVVAAPFFAGDWWLSDAGSMLGIVWNIVVLLATLRVATVFPAIAVDASCAGLGRAYADLTGRAGRVVAVALPVLLPIMLVPVLSVRAVSTLFEGNLFARLIVELGNGVIDTVVEILFLVIVSRLYLWSGADTHPTD